MKSQSERANNFIATRAEVSVRRWPRHEPIIARTREGAKCIITVTRTTFVTFNRLQHQEDNKINKTVVFIWPRELKLHGYGGGVGMRLK